MKRSFWKTDWFLGVLIALAFLFAARSDLLQSLERKAYDLGVQASSRTPSDQIAVIAIDERSIANLGLWPWPRDIHARMIDILSAAEAKVVGNTVLFLEPQRDPGLVYIDRLLQFYGSSTFKTAANPTLQAEAARFEALLREAEQKLNTDRTLAESLGKSKNVLLAMRLQLGESRGKPDQPLPDYVQKNILTNVKDNIGAEAAGDRPLSAMAAASPIAAIGSQATAIGHLDTHPDVDGGIRTEALVLRYYDQYLPSLSVMLAAKSLNLEPKDIRVNLGQGISLGNLKIATDPALQMRTFFYKGTEGKPAFQVDSFYDVYSGKIPAAKYRGKIVLIGATAAGIGVSQATPISVAMAPVLTLAHSVSSILKEDFYVSPRWSSWAEMGVFLFVALYLILLLPRLKAGMGAALTAFLLIALLSTHFLLMMTQAIWLQLMAPAVLLLTGHLLLTAKRHLLTAAGKAPADAESESAVSNRMLGLAFQGQGQLDIAFDKFRECPLDESLMNVLYNLGLDFERKLQFNKAESVFRYMAGFNSGFRDIRQHIEHSKAMQDAEIAGSSGDVGTPTPGGGAMKKFMLGRYQVEKELGKGAMGVVYLGKDPKIGRVVAIKTMALSQEFDDDELVEVKERFFREAETAGRLNHPNIVTIYDAGEEHDLAFISMEFLKGNDLAPYTKPGNLLPPQTVFSIISRVADALAYAHSQHVVHRDIKPANIMYEPESDSVKVTDFGIARITDSSKTRTGMVLGTPSYMSPEQLAGKKIGGSSDLFSLGVMLYQLLTGQLPFKGDTMAQLMYRIANEPHPNLLTIDPSLPPCASAIIDKILQKQPEQRFQTGADLARAIRACAAYAAKEK